MEADIEQGTVVLSQSDLELAQSYRTGYIQRQCVKGENLDPLAVELQPLPVEEGRFACSAEQAIQIGMLACESNKFHLGRYKKCSQDISIQARKLGPEAYEKADNIAKEKQMADEAAKASAARCFSQSIDAVLQELPQAVEHPPVSV